MTVLVVVAATVAILVLALGLVLLHERWTISPDHTEQKVLVDKADDGP